MELPMRPCDVLAIGHDCDQGKLHGASPARNMQRLFRGRFFTCVKAAAGRGRRRRRRAAWTG
jgi:hypothetical protein